MNGFEEMAVAGECAPNEMLDSLAATLEMVGCTRDQVATMTQADLVHALEEVVELHDRLALAYVQTEAGGAA